MNDKVLKKLKAINRKLWNAEQLTWNKIDEGEDNWYLLETLLEDVSKATFQLEKVIQSIQKENNNDN